MPATLQYRLTTNGLGGSTTGAVLSEPSGGIVFTNWASFVIPPEALNNLFDNVIPSEALAGDVEYRAVDVYNAGDEDAAAVQIFGYGSPTENTGIKFGIEASPLNSTTAIPDESTAPTISGSFATYTEAAKLDLPDIPVGEYCRIWIQRSVVEGATNKARDGVAWGIWYA